MLSLSAIDLAMLAVAMSGSGGEPGASWWLDPRTGEVILWSGDVEDDTGVTAESLEGRGAIRVDPVESRTAWRDMRDFVAAVEDDRARELLDLAINGPGAFRRFRTTLNKFPELGDQWARYRDRQMRRHAITWLAEQGVVARPEADRALAG